MTANARTVLGVPFLPSPTLSTANVRIRDRIRRVHRGLAPPPVQILEAALSLLDHRVLVELCAAGVPDVLTGRITMGELTARIEGDPERVHRLIRFASTRGWLSIDRKGRVRPNRITEFLRVDHSSGWRSWVDFLSVDAVVAAVAAFGLDTDHDAFAAINGAPFFEWMKAHPPERATFDLAMAAGGRMHALTLNAAVTWGATSTVCDVGGGTGDLINTLVDLHPAWHGAVFDLPDVIDRAVPHQRIEHLAGDAFVAIPRGFDTYLLVNVVHDWNDEDATRILHNVAEVLGPHGRLFVVDSRARSVPRDEISISADILMAALTNGGMERSDAAFARLGSDAGLQLTSTHSLASTDVAYEFRRARSCADGAVDDR